jgi:hypothetical protein
MRRLAAPLMLVILLLSACSGTPTPDIEATVRAGVAAALTALPTDTPTPTPTDTPATTPTPNAHRHPGHHADSHTRHRGHGGGGGRDCTGRVGHPYAHANSNPHAKADPQS